MKPDTEDEGLCDGCGTMFPESDLGTCSQGQTLCPDCMADAEQED